MSWNCNLNPATPNVESTLTVVHWVWMAPLIQNAKHFKNKDQALPNWHNFCLFFFVSEEEIKSLIENNHISIPIIFEQWNITKTAWNSQWSPILSRNLKRYCQLPIFCPYFSLFCFVFNFFKKSSKSGHGNLVLTTSSWTLKVELQLWWYKN